MHVVCVCVGECAQVCVEVGGEEDKVDGAVLEAAEEGGEDRRWVLKKGER